jgi:hypothetical protein
MNYSLSGRNFIVLKGNLIKVGRIFLRLRSLVQLLPEDFKQRIKPKIDGFTALNDEDKNRIGNEIGFHPMLTVGGVPFPETKMARKIRKQEIIGIIMEERIEEIIGDVSSCLHEALKEERTKS